MTESFPMILSCHDSVGQSTIDALQQTGGRVRITPPVIPDLGGQEVIREPLLLYAS